MKTFNKFNLLIVIISAIIFSSSAHAGNCNLQGFVTYTQGGWGSPSNSTPGQIRDQYFQSVFPNGLVVGGNYKITFTCASAVQSFLPQGGKASFLTKNYTNPTSTSAGVLGGQIVALAMNLAYDKANKLGTNSLELEDLVIVSGKFAGKTVAEFFSIANAALGGSSTGYSLSDINDAATSLNENFDEGKKDKGFLTCPVTTGSIGDKVWNDTNKNGIQDAGEQGVANVTVQLYSYLFLKATTTTDANGNYLFSNLPAGIYYVKFILPAGYSLSPKNSGSNDELDSDADQSTGSTDIICLAAGQNDLKWDAGIYKPEALKATIGDRVWNDINKNGIQESGETGVADVTVKLFTCANALVDTKTTDSNGNYLFDNLTPGDYYVMFTLPANYAFSPKNSGSDVNKDSDADQTTGKTTCVTLTGGCPNLSVDAGIYENLPQKASLGDRVWNDANNNGIQDNGETGVSGVAVSLYDCGGTFKASTNTDANGNYLFGNLDAGSYYIKVTLPNGYAFTTKDEGTDNAVDSDVDQTTGQTACVTLVAGQNDMTEDAGIYIKKSSVGDKVWNDINQNGIQDNNEDGISNVTVKLFTCENTLVATKVTDQSGLYKFDNLMPGDYYVTFTLPENYVFSPMGEGENDVLDSDAEPSTGRTVCFNLAAGINDMNWDAGMYYVAPSVNADLSLTKVVSEAHPKIGETISYTVKVTNNGPAAATGVVVSDLLHTGLDFVSAAPTKGAYDHVTGKWTVGSLNANESANLVITVKVNPNSVSSNSFDLGAAADFNLFVFEDLTQPSSDTQGRVAVGNDATLGGYSVGDQLPNSHGAVDVLVVGHNLTYTSGRVYNGNVVYGNTTNLPIFAVSYDEGTLRKDSPINFAQAKAYLQSLSTQISSNAASGTTKSEWGGLELTGTDPFLNVFKVSGADLSKANNVSISVPNGAVVLINIDGQSVKWSGGLSVTGTEISNVLYNFYQATSLTIQGIDVRGSILAPFADLDFPSGLVSGQVIVKSMKGSGQFNNVKFIGNIPSYPDIVNIAEVFACDQHDPDSTPDNGVDTEDDYASVTIQVNTEDSSSGTGVGNGTGNTNWEYVGNFTDGEIVGKIVVDNGGNLLAGTWGGKIFKSTDKGTTWTRINPNMNASYIWVIAVSADGKIFTGTEKGIFMTADNGATWNAAGLSGKDVRAVVIKSGVLYAGTWGFGIFKSSDNGNTWTEINKGLENLAVHALTVNSNGEIFAGTFGAGIFSSADNGVNWTKLNMPYSFVWALDCTASNTIFAGTYGDGVYRSTDGVNFEKANAGITAQFIYAISANVDGKLFISSWTNGVYTSTDGGNNWNSLGMNGYSVSSITAAPSSKALYVGTSNGSVYRNVSAVTAVNGSKSEVPTTYELMQNYPNPFNPSTTINFNIPEAGRYSLKIYDILGREVTTLVNEELKAGKYSYRFDASSLSSGFYIYQLHGDNVNMTKKMMLLK